MRYHTAGEREPGQVRQITVAESLEMIASETTPISVGVHSYLTDGRPLRAAFTTGFRSGSFKERGGIGKTMMLSEAGFQEAVLYSAGNHLTGVALGSRASGLLVHGFVPEYAPQVKLDLAEQLGEGNVDVRRVKGDLAQAKVEAYQLASELGVPVIEPFDDEDIARFQGTVMHEFLLRRPDIDHVVVPEGGGGLEAGCIRAIRELGRNTKVHGAQLSAEYELCEGSYVKGVGKVALQARQQNPDIWGQTFRVDPADVGAMVALEDAARSEQREAMGEAAFEGYPEATALLGAAAVHKFYEKLEGNVAVIVTGSNADQSKLTTLHDRYVSSIVSTGVAGFRTASGYQLRQRAA